MDGIHAESVEEQMISLNSAHYICRGLLALRTLEQQPKKAHSQKSSRTRPIGLAESRAPSKFRQKGTRLGNWLRREQAKELLAMPDRSTLKGKRDYVIIALLVGCALRRQELASLKIDDIQLLRNTGSLDRAVTYWPRMFAMLITPWTNRDHTGASVRHHR